MEKVFKRDQLIEMARERAEWLREVHPNLEHPLLSREAWHVAASFHYYSSRRTCRYTKAKLVQIIKELDAARAAILAA